MVKKIKFPLKMSDNTQIRSLEELRAHFDLESVLGYYANGKLVEWLNDRYYEHESEQIKKLDANALDFKQRLCEIFCVEYSDDTGINITDISLRNNRITQLKQFTTDENIIASVDNVAFTQEELADLLDARTNTIYLCGKTFTIPISIENVTYIGINEPVVEIPASFEIDFETKNIVLINTRFDESYQRLINKTMETVNSRKTIHVSENLNSMVRSDNNLVIHDDWVYYKYSNSLHKMKTDGTEKKDLFVNITSDYLHKSVKYLHAISVNTMILYEFASKQVNNVELPYNNIFQFLIYDEQIYYIANNKLYTSELDGTNQVKLIDGLLYNTSFTICGEWIYYAKSHVLYKMNIHQRQEVNLNIFMYGFYVNTNSIYYFTNSGDIYYLCEADLAGNEKNRYFEFRKNRDYYYNPPPCDKLFVDNDWLYYLDVSTKGSRVWKAKIGEADNAIGVISTTNFNIENFAVLDNKIYIHCFKSKRNGSLIYERLERYSINGNQEMIFD